MSASSDLTPQELPIIGMIGGGQLARMTHQAAIGLGLPLRIMAATPTDSAALVSPSVGIGDPHSAADLERFAVGCQVITVDHELVNLDALRDLAAQGVDVHPPADALAFATDKAHQRRAFAAAELPLPRHRLTSDIRATQSAAAELGWPVVIKTARGGYDGRGVWIIDSPAALEAVLSDIAGRSADGAQAEGPDLSHPELLVEELLDLDLELAVLIARRADGTAIEYPVIESIQVDGICRETIVPARIPPEIEATALEVGRRVAEVVGAVGVIAVELFVSKGKVTINEVATRPHNSGHWTIEGSVTSQFANHLRAVASLPLGATATRAPAVVMANILGADTGRDPHQHLSAALGLPEVAVHLYGKGPRPGRKLGHVTVMADTVEAAREIAHEAVARLGDPVPSRP